MTKSSKQKIRKYTSSSNPEDFALRGMAEKGRAEAKEKTAYAKPAKPMKAAGRDKLPAPSKPKPHPAEKPKSERSSHASRAEPSPAASDHPESKPERKLPTRPGQEKSGRSGPTSRGGTRKTKSAPAERKVDQGFFGKLRKSTMKNYKKYKLK